MKKPLALFAAVTIFATFLPTAGIANSWSADELSRLHSWMRAATEDALPKISTNRLDRAVASRDQAAIDLVASEEALRLGRMHLLGCSNAAQRAGWNIASHDERLELVSLLKQALRRSDIDGFFADLQPRHPEYWALRSLYQEETDPARRKQLARNMERWRWMPLELGWDHLIVNIPHYRVTYWQGGKKRGIWPVIVGKKRTPTPVFSAQVTGVTFNPWWNIPKSIVRESVGALVRRNPAEARRRGYVWGGGRYRQRPGPTNALGLMKLAMPNPYSVYMHDTPNRALFDEPVRMFSHGCIRTGDALGFASTLVERSKSRSDVDAIIVKGETVTIPLVKPLPVYITYFTAAVGDDGAVAYFPDIYRRDGRMGDSSNPAQPCAG